MLTQYYKNRILIELFDTPYATRGEREKEIEKKRKNLKQKNIIRKMFAIRAG